MRLSVRMLAGMIASWTSDGVSCGAPSCITGAARTARHLVTVCVRIRQASLSAMTESREVDGGRPLGGLWGFEGESERVAFGAKAESQRGG